jgi:hypothetical protein
LPQEYLAGDGTIRAGFRRFLHPDGDGYAFYGAELQPLTLQLLQ